MKPLIQLALSAGLLLACQALACQVPVFRYALARWQTDNYHVVVVHQAPLTEEQKKAQEEERVNTAKMVTVYVSTRKLIKQIWNLKRGTLFMQKSSSVRYTVFVRG